MIAILDLPVAAQARLERTRLNLTAQAQLALSVLMRVERPPNA